MTCNYLVCVVDPFLQLIIRFESLEVIGGVIGP
jgi:hypothetical protein